MILSALLEPNVAYIVLVLALVLTILALFAPGTGFLEAAALAALIASGFSIANIPVNSWAGGYCYSPDAIPFVYLDCGVLVVNGASGSGIMKSDAMARIADALYRGKSYAELYGGRKMSTKTLSIKERDVEVESVVI